jgi:hypothetical protein
MWLNVVSSMVSPISKYKIPSHLMCFSWSIGLFLFLFCLNKMDPSIPCVGERHAPLLHMDNYVLSLYS